MIRLLKANRLYGSGNTVSYRRFFDDYAVKPLNSIWLDTGVSGFSADKLYVVQTLSDVIQRCILMSLLIQIYSTLLFIAWKETNAMA